LGKEEKEMRLTGILMFFWAFFALNGPEGFAQEKPTPPKASPPPAVNAVPSEGIRMGGIIIAIDPARHKVLVQQYRVGEEKIVTLNLDKEGIDKVSAFRKGDAVNIWVKGNTLIKIEKIPDPAWEEIREEGK
jgi:hypothetical protein